VLVLGAVLLSAVVLLERDLRAERKRTFVACEQVPKRDGAKATRRLRYDAVTGNLINVETGEIE
jgi:hypothetical protein